MASKLLCENVLRGVDTYSEATILNFTFSNAVNGSTALQAGFAKDADREVIYDLGAQASFNTVCFAKHNLKDAVSSVEIYTGDGVSGPWTLAHSVTPTSNKVQYHIFDFSTTRYVKITVTDSTIDRYIGNISLGLTLHISDGQYVGFVQPDYAPTHNLIANVTRGGEIAGIIRQQVPVKTTIEARHIKKSWLDANWFDLNECLTKYPFYFKWGDDAEPIYCWARKIKSPSWTTISRLSFSIETEGFL